MTAELTTTAEATHAFEDGMRNQLAHFSRRLAAGMPRAGWKVCVNDAPLQKRLGLAGSFAAFLDGDRALASGGTWTLEPGAAPGVEPEFAIRLGTTVDAGAAPSEVRAAIAGVAPALEVVDWRDARLDLGSMAASSSFHAGFVVGDLRPLAAVPAIGDGCPRLARGDEVLGVPDPSLVPADLADLVSHVAAVLARFGQRLEAGDWLLCGACTNPARVEPGDVVEADFATLGKVSVRFEG